MMAPDIYPFLQSGQIVGLIGGLGLFLFGMKFLSDALRNASSERIKKILGFLTKNPVNALMGWTTMEMAWRIWMTRAA